MKRNLLLKIIITLTIITLMCVVCYHIFINKIFDIAGKNLSQIELTEDELIDIKNTDEKPEQTEKQTQKSITHENHKTKDEKTPPKPSQKQTQKTAKTEVTFEDKQRAVKLISSKLSIKDVNYLISLFQGGLTPEKKRQAVKLAQERYSTEEIKEIRALYHKYIKNLR